MSDTAKIMVMEHALDGSRLREAFFQENADAVVDVARIMAVCIARGGKVLLCGNGGSAADAQHLAAEFVNRFIMDRPPLPAIALTTDSSVLTSIGNDFGFEQVFSKQVQALGQQGDVLIAISTSGGSPNVLAALRAAAEKGVITVGLTGKGGGAMAELCDYLIDVKDSRTPLIQEIHIAVGHLLCGLVDHYLFENVLELQPWLEQPAESR
ncbi:Phosphoheptose isomerase [Oleidesulfovibrio alaskensis G20]|uniref:Phosphoheptose isomerase n=1 Tax=Oleidesulfovibrio alaskensis (strain ATCC BAA-1058 / DSM 17464 / G20) TaxID=207559 RepID=Q30Y31_OLEA2|nr:D-sedoheptulose 7-phosphate isomerase [Oleidesulfovibrio alaskensis]ABB39415.2 Phosphoheptose isomerase [Oleidesulfovibrio alaskensis G20]MBG0772506.1 D-sedoheptulose 7-phosphate isomerase [Oleidesulfovibrio alaskensis]MBL3582132.1 D-sedoheptulose 7-phosphate isomerase [Oleidesulfovibrio alaskensis]